MSTTLEILVGALEVALSDTSVAHFVGAKHLHTNEARAPRIVWIETGGTIEPPYLAIGKARFTKDGKLNTFRYRYDRVMSVQAHIWERSLDDLERLQGRLLSVTRAAFGTGSQPGSYVLDTEGEHASRVRGAQAAGMQAFTWRACVAEWTGVERDELGTLVPFKRLAVVSAQNVIGTIDPDLA